MIRWVCPRQMASVLNIGIFWVLFLERGLAECVRGRLMDHPHLSKRVESMWGNMWNNITVNIRNIFKSIRKFFPRLNAVAEKEFSDFSVVFLYQRFIKVWFIESYSSSFIFIWRQFLYKWKNATFRSLATISLMLYNCAIKGHI